MEPALWPTLADAAAMFEARGLAFAFIGGLAVSLRGQPRMTVDVSVVIVADVDRALELAGELAGLIAVQKDAIDWPACLALARTLGAAVDVDVAGRLEAAGR